MVGTLQAISVGYFAWDLVNELVWFDDVGFVVHGAACLAIYVYSFVSFLVPGYALLSKEL